MMLCLGEPRLDARLPFLAGVCSSVSLATDDPPPPHNTVPLSTLRPEFVKLGADFRVTSTGERIAAKTADGAPSAAIAETVVARLPPPGPAGLLPGELFQCPCEGRASAPFTCRGSVN